MSTPVKYTFGHFNEILAADLENNKVVALGGNKYAVTLASKKYEIDILSIDYNEKRYELVVNGVKLSGNGFTQLDTLIEQLGFEDSSGVSAKEVHAPMPGLILNIEVSVGDEVAEGDSLVILEAMKMENIIKAHTSGKVAAIEVIQGESVEKEQLLITFE